MTGAAGFDAWRQVPIPFRQNRHAPAALAPRYDAVPGADVEQFSALFFGTYKASGYDLDDWLIGRATQAKSAKERMMEALNKLT